MIRRLQWSVLLFMCLMIIIGSACAPKIDSTLSASLQAADQSGKTVTLDQAPERIISIAPMNTEIVYALGLQDKLVAVTDYCDYPPEARNKPRIGGFATPNIEQIVALHPDLVLATSQGEKTFLPQLTSRGIKVAVLAPKSLTDVLDAISIISKLAGQDKTANNLLKEMDRRIKAVAEKTIVLKPNQKPKVFYPIWHDPLMAGGAGTMHDEIISRAGGINISGSLAGYANFSLEAVLQANPDIMIAGTAHGADGSLTLGFLKNEPRLANTSARLNNRIFEVDDNLVSRAGPRSVDGLEQVAHIIHPELFGSK